MAERVHTGCNNCKRCTNSPVAEFGRRAGKGIANTFTFGSVAAVQAFTPTCRGCGHKMSLHDVGDQSHGNSYTTPVNPGWPMQPQQSMPPQPMQVHALPAQPAPGWFPDPQLPGVARWWDGTQWTAHTQPLGPPPAYR